MKNLSMPISEACSLRSNRNATDYEEQCIYTADWRKIVKDPSKFVAKHVAKGVEISWRRLNEERRRAMAEAKQVEIKEWVASKVCEAALGEVDPARVMRMRWVLVFKGTDDPAIVKARLVVLGFSDPDVGLLNTKSPSMPRRSRQLMLQFSTMFGLKLPRRMQKLLFSKDLPHKARDPFLVNLYQTWQRLSTLAKVDGAIPNCSLWTHHRTKRVPLDGGPDGGWTGNDPPEDRSMCMEVRGSRSERQAEDFGPNWLARRRLPHDGTWRWPTMDRTLGTIPFKDEMEPMGSTAAESLRCSSTTRFRQQLALGPGRALWWDWPDQGRLHAVGTISGRTSSSPCCAWRNSVEGLPNWLPTCGKAELLSVNADERWSIYDFWHQQFFCCERLSASMARSLHLRFSLCTASDPRPGPGGDRTAASCQPQAWRPSAIPLHHRRRYDLWHQQAGQRSACPERPCTLSPTLCSRSRRFGACGMVWCRSG